MRDSLVIWLRRRRFLFVVLCLWAWIPARAATLTTLPGYTVEGVKYHALRDIAKLYGFALSIPPGKKIYLRNKWRILEFEVETRTAWINDTRVFMNMPVRKTRAGWALAEVDLKKVIDPLMRPYAYLASRGYKTVVLDPGHGGGDPGARGKAANVVEKLANLDVARRVRAKLMSEGVKVHLTRDTDKAMSLESRAAVANQRAADVFVSIHFNSASSSAASGVETYVLSSPGYASTASDPRSKGSSAGTVGNRFDQPNSMLAYHVQKALVQATGAEDRGVKRARFAVLTNVNCPAVLVEAGFLSNTKEERRVVDAAYRDRIAQGITRGILDYINSVKKARVGGGGA